ncbi:MAG: diaminopimelate decarboxylase [Bacteroidia bacterium]|nr:diaminopimelate decarboxylase [Bacteroidia bacterium]
MRLENGKYWINDKIDPLDLVQTYGVPTYVYDTSIMKDHYDRLCSAFKGVRRLKINYACKALTNINIVRFFKNLGSGLDTVSIQEVLIGLKAGFDPHDIMYTPNGVSIEEFTKAKNLGVRINIDNLEILDQFGSLYSDHPVSIRINPHIMAGGNAKISVGHIDSKFGISIHQMDEVLEIIQKHEMRVEGVHMHTGSDILDVDVFSRAAQVLLNTAKKFKNLDFLDFGSGFKVPYKLGDVHTNIEYLGEKITAQFNEFIKEYGKDLELIFEPGKFLVSEAGYLLARVNVIKQSMTKVFAQLDSGQNHLLRPMFYDAFHKIINISNTDGPKKIYDVVGYICETDTFGVNREINEIHPNDILAFRNAGAYCFMMSSNYNSRFRPAEVLVHEGDHYLIRKRETMDDILRNQIEIKELKPLNLA